MKIFLLEADQLVNDQISQYIAQTYKVDLKLFTDSKQLIRASVSYYPDMIIFGIDENSKNLFEKLSSFRKSFNTKLVVIVSAKDAKDAYPLEIAHHILYKPFTLEELDHCLANYLGVKKISSTEDIQQEEIQQLDILESSSFDFESKNNFARDDNDAVSMDDVRQELYDDVMVLDSNVEADAELEQAAQMPKHSQFLQKSFNPEVHVKNKHLGIVVDEADSLLKNYFQKVHKELNEVKLGKPAASFDDAQQSSKIVFNKEQKISEQKISSLDLSSLEKYNSKDKNEEFADNVLSASDFNLKFLD